jgi:hypothetical protein
MRIVSAWAGTGIRIAGGMVLPPHETHECCWRLRVDDSEQLMVRLTKKGTAMLNEQPGTSALTFYWTQRAR